MVAVLDGVTEGALVGVLLGKMITKPEMVGVGVAGARAHPSANSNIPNNRRMISFRICIAYPAREASRKRVVIRHSRD